MREKDPKKMEAIFQATLQLVLQEGFTALKMSAIAQKAGVAAGTIYLYFGSKDDLINQLYLHLKRQTSAAYLKSYKTSMTFSEGFQTIWFNYLETALAFPEATAFVEQYYRSPYLKAEMRSASDLLLQPIFDLMERGKKEGVIANVPVSLLVAQLSGSLNEVARWHISGAIQLDEETRRQAFALAWKSVKA